LVHGGGSGDQNRIRKKKKQKNQKRKFLKVQFGNTARKRAQT